MAKLGALLHATKALAKDRLASSKLFEETLQRVKDGELEPRRAIALFSLFDSDVNKWFLLMEPKDDGMDHSNCNIDVHALVLSLSDDASSGIVDYILAKLDLGVIEGHAAEGKRLMLGLAQLIMTGHLPAFVAFQHRFPDVFAWSDQHETFPLVNVLHAWSELLLTEMTRQTVRDLYTWGANDNISLGHTGGTLPKWPLKMTSPKGKRNVHAVDKVELGLSTTVFVSSNRPFVHISGKLGSKHYLEPETFEFKEPIVCAAVGASHLMLCTKRLNAPDDTFSRPHRGFLGASVLDRTTALFSGSRVKVFVDYDEHEFTVTRTAAGAYIVSATACKPQFNQSKLTVAMFMSTCELWLWDKTSGLSLVWRLGKYPIATPMGQHSFAFGTNGQFMFVHDDTLYNGSVVHSVGNDASEEASRFKGLVRRAPGSLGTMKRVFMSSDGENYAALVVRHRTSKSRIDPVERRERRRQLKSLMNSPGCKTVSFVAQSRKSFVVPQFLLFLRNAEKVLHKAAKTDYCVNLKKVDEEALEAVIEFLYTGTCELFTSLSGGGNENNNKTEAGEDIEDVLASKLRKLRTLASDIDYEALHTAADKYLQQLYEADTDAPVVDWSEENTFARYSVEVGDLFPDGDVLVVCSDARVKFSGEILKLKSAYFETLFRWNEDEQIDVISFEEFAFRLVRLALFFFLTEDLREADLSFEELVEVFFFADRYGLTDLIAQVVDLLEEELVIGRLEEFFDLLQNFYAPDLEAVVSDFVYANLVSVLESPSVGHIPPNILESVNERIRMYFESHKDIQNVLPFHRTMDSDASAHLQFYNIADEILDEVLPTLSDDEFERFCENPVSFLKARFRGASERERRSTCRSSVEKDATADSGILSCSVGPVNDSSKLDTSVVNDDEDEKADEMPEEEAPVGKKGKRRIRYRSFAEYEQEQPDSSHAARKISESSNASESSFSTSQRSSHAWTSSPATPQSLTKSLREIQLEEERAVAASVSRRSQEPKVLSPPVQSTPVKAERKRFVSTTSVENGPVLSLREIQEQELAAVAHAQAQQQRTAQAHQERNRRVSIPNPKEPITNGHAPSPQPLSLRDIQAQEQAALDSAAAARVKPLWALQKEEQAIQELYTYYDQMFPDGTVVSIRRIRPPTTQ